MDNRLKRLKGIGKFVSVIVIIFCVYKLVLNIFFMGCLCFPDNVKVVKSDVSFSDTFGLHLVADEIIETDLSDEEIYYLRDKSWISGRLRILKIDFDSDGKAHDYSEWDDSIMDISVMDGKEEAGKNYYVLSQSTYGLI